MTKVPRQAGRPAAQHGGGYQHVQVVPRSWTHLLFEVAGHPLDPGSQAPVLWREYVSWVTAQEPPERMTEGGLARFVAFETGCDPAELVDRAIMATRRVVFPQHGLTP